jgi:hypothetical protein
MSAQQQTERTDYITFIGGDVADITRQFQAQGLSEADYSIVHRIGSHRFTRVEGDVAEPLFEGRRMIAATFARRSAT